MSTEHSSLGVLGTELAILSAAFDAVLGPFGAALVGTPVALDIHSSLGVAADLQVFLLPPLVDASLVGAPLAQDVHHSHSLGVLGSE